MKQIPGTANATVIRTDFSDQAAWETICAEIRKPVGLWRFLANVDLIDDQQYADLTKDQLLELIPTHYKHSFIVMVDRTAISQPWHPLLIVDLFDEAGREFRAVPSAIQGIENNLSIGNMDFEEFADAVDKDGVFRGFPES